MSTRLLYSTVFVLLLGVISLVWLKPPDRLDASSSLVSQDEIIITILKPQPQELVGEELKIETTINSTFELQSVIAQVETLTTTLVFSRTTTYPPRDGFVGALSLVDLGRGAKTLVVTAMDVFSNVYQTQVDFVYDREPVLSISAPDDFTVARPSLSINVSCDDDDPGGCNAVECIYDDLVLATGQTSISQTLSLYDYDGQTVYLGFKATDSANQSSYEQRAVYIESSPMLAEITNVDGRIWDIDSDAILFLQSQEAADVLKIRNRLTGQDTIIMDDPGKNPQYGFLAPKGAIFVAESANVLTSALYEWRDSVLIDLGQPNSAGSVQVAGDYAIWNVDTLLFRRDLTKGTTAQVATNAGNTGNGLAANGDVVYWSRDYQIVRYRDGITTLLTSDTGYEHVYPTTDGINVVYKKRKLDSTTFTIALYDALGETILDSGRPLDWYYQDKTWDYQLNNGWIAFSRPDASGQRQIWLCSPSGEESQITYFGNSSCIDSIAPNGQVTFVHAARLYLAAPGEDIIEIGSNNDYFCQTFWQDEELFRTIGRSVFRVNPSLVFLPLVLRERN